MSSPWLGKRPRTGKPCVDHTGVSHPSWAAMCRAWGRPLTTVLNRLRRDGMTLEQALTAPRSPRSGKPVQIGGVVYRSARLAGAAVGISHGAMLDRIAAGTKLDAPPRKKRHGAVRDHLGNVYPSRSARAQVYGLTRQTIDYRLKQGLSLRAALTAPSCRRQEAAE